MLLLSSDLMSEQRTIRVLIPLNVFFSFYSGILGLKLASALPVKTVIALVAATAARGKLPTFLGRSCLLHALAHKMI